LLNRLKRKIGKHFVHQEILRFATNQRTLDLGCGKSPLADAFPNRVGLDIVPALGVHIVADVHRLPFVSGSFEQVVCSEVFEHLVDPRQAAWEIARVLGDGGRLVLTTPFVYPIHEAPHDYQRFTMYGLRQLFSPGFEIQTIKELYTEEQTLAILVQRIAFQRQDFAIRHYIYLLLAHLIFHFLGSTNSLRYQDISHRVEGPFLTAGYLLIARKRTIHSNG
jgi:SAM-dependent methyltransferase